MLPIMFKGAKVGDEVFSIKKGWGKITTLDNDDTEQVEIDGMWYFPDGRRYILDIAPSCWPAHLVPQYYLDLCPRPKRKVVKTVECYLNIYANGDLCAHPTAVKACKEARFNPIATAVHLTGTYEVEE